MYSFPPWMFVSPNSPCHTTENLTLSQQDRIGFSQAYPSTPAELTRMRDQSRLFLSAVMNSAASSQTKDSFKSLLDALR
jgi:hypothetical protein